MQFGAQLLLRVPGSIRSGPGAGELGRDMGAEKDLPGLPNRVGRPKFDGCLANRKAEKVPLIAGLPDFLSTG